MTYTIVAGNAGPSDDPAVTLTDTLPTELNCNWTSTAMGGATGNTASGSGDLTESLSMPAGSSVTYTGICGIDPSATGTLSNTATISGSSPIMGPAKDGGKNKINNAGGSTTNSDNDLTNNSATDQNTLLTPEADISVTKTDGVTTAVPGQTTLTYTIVASNAGPSDDPSVSLVDSFPAVLSCSYTSVAAGGASGNTAVGAGNLAETLSMPSGSSVTYTVNCTIDSAATGTLSNTATVSASVTDNNLANNSATDNDTALNRLVDLAVTKTDGVSTAVPGQDTLIYTIVASNNGPSDDPGAFINDDYPAGLSCTFTSVFAGGSALVTDFSNSVRLQQDISLPSGAKVTYTVTCIVDAATVGVISNSAQVATATTETDQSNNLATDETSLTPETDLSVSKTDGEVSVFSGENLTYTLLVSNNGPSDSSGGTVTDVLPSGLSFVSSASGCSEAGGVVSCPFGPLTVGSSVSLSFVALTEVADTTRVLNTATVNGNDTDPISSNDSGSDVTAVVKIFPPIPTISGWMLLLMMILFAGLGVQYIRQER